MPTFSELWVCFRPPSVEPPSDVVVLSFLPPRSESLAETKWGARCVKARVIAEEVRDEARALYLGLITRVSATRLEGRTLREALQGTDGVSRWWYLKTSEKDSLLVDEIYPVLIQLLCIKRVGERYGIRRIQLYGAPEEFKSALSGAFEVTASHAVRRKGGLAAAVRAVSARVAGLIFYGRIWWILARRRHTHVQRLDVLLEAHWDWSVQPGPDGRLRDRYFTDLPDELARRKVIVGWLAWCEPDTAVWQRGRTLRQVVEEALRHPAIVLAERYIRPFDILRSMLDFRYLLAFLRLERRAEFRALFGVKDLDLYPVLRRQLIEYLAGSSVARWELLATATHRVCLAHRPRMILTFLELFLHSRAIFAGARRASVNVRLWAAQHASYCRDKTFGLMDPDRELRGEPDGCSVPAPDGLFVMGDLSREIWLRNGYDAERVVVTGGLRYQHVRVDQKTRVVLRPVVILLAASMIGSAELELCDAVCAATDGLPVRIRLRDHPYSCLSERPEFAPYRARIEVTSGTAGADLDSADLVLFTHSGLSEEALVRGLPTWQWLGAGVNTSVFLDLPGVVPAFTSVETLRRAFESFLEDPDAYRPRRETQELVVQRCFGPDPPGASVAIADRIVVLLGGGHDAVRRETGHGLQ